MRVIVTRPEREARRWVDELGARGFDAVALPLIDIAPVADTAPLHAAWRRLEAFRAAMFVSANAVEAFFAARPGGAPAAASVRMWATGPGTRAALLQAGVAAACIDAPSEGAAQFDSEALWRQAGGQVRPGDRVLVVRGADAAGEGAGRDWLATQVAAAGGAAEFCVAYERHMPVFDAAQSSLAQAAARDGSAWLFSSSQAIAHLARLLPGQGWAQARAVATHARIAQAARDAGFGVVCESRPALAAVAASIESLR